MRLATTGCGLFQWRFADMRAKLLAQDVIWEGGGSVANLLALWRLHRLDKVKREAFEAGGA